MTIRDALKDCQDQVNRLEVENQDLRRSALEFGEPSVSAELCGNGREGEWLTPTTRAEATADHHGPAWFFGQPQKSKRVVIPNVRGWFVRNPMRARVPRSRSSDDSARSSVTLLTKTPRSQVARRRPTRRLTMS